MRCPFDQQNLSPYRHGEKNLFYCATCKTYFTKTAIKSLSVKPRTPGTNCNRKEQKMSYQEVDRDIRRTLRDIFEHIGVNVKHASNATLRTYLERLIRRHGGKID